MCGIVACLEKKQALPFLLNGLKQLEYRGYDSAGLAIYSQKEIRLLRAVGDASKLISKAKNNKPKGVLGIAHTRWATHGKVSLKNTHPHSDNKKQFFVVHNGIIENFQEIKDFLSERGTNFQSDTDTEVIPQLLAYNFAKVKDVRQALLTTLQTIQGAFAIAMICKHEPNKLWGAKLSSPLILGLGSNGTYLASDTLALAGKAERFIALEDNEVVEITKDEYKLSDVKGKQRDLRTPELLHLEEQQSLVGEFPDLMSQEIASIPQVVENAIRGRLKVKQNLIKLGGLDLVRAQLNHIKRIIIIGCGSSYYAGLVAEYLLEEIADIPVEVQLASEFRYRHEPLSRSTAVIVISQSGETADTIGALQKVSDSGLLKLGIINVPGSTISRMVDAGVYCRAGRERSVAATKSFISQLICLSLIALYLKNDKSNNLQLLKALAKLPQQLEAVLNQRKLIDKIAKRYAKSKGMLVIGRRYTYPLSLEVALKLKEICYIHGQGLAAGEIKHGSMALIDKNCPTLAFVLSNQSFTKTCNNLAEIKARSGTIIAIVDKEHPDLKHLADEFIVIPKTIEAFQPVLAATAGYLFSYATAKALKRPIDKPRNLAKSVTVE